MCTNVPPGAKGSVPAGVVCSTFYKCTLSTNCTKDTRAITSWWRTAFQFMRMFDSIDLNGQIFGNVVDESADENLISILFLCWYGFNCDCNLTKTSFKCLIIWWSDTHYGDDECNGCDGDQRLKWKVCLHSWWWLQWAFTGKQRRLEFLSLELLQFSQRKLKLKRKHHRHPCPTMQRGE